MSNENTQKMLTELAEQGRLTTERANFQITLNKGNYNSLEKEQGRTHD